MRFYKIADKRHFIATLYYVMVLQLIFGGTLVGISPGFGASAFNRVAVKIHF